MRRGFTLIEMATVLVLIAALLASVAPMLLGWRDRLAVRQAAWDLIGFYQAARYAAITRATRVRIELTPDTLRAIGEGDREAVLIARAGPARRGVSLTATRDVIRVSPNGIGWGAANTTIVLRRGGISDSLTTSRLGRLRRL
ncbi:MAG TPA: prepilin-type N-terminal cleavage/methylation domain-containing protein [Gemmatimonadales bacterium]